jgi:deaminated glutathione amidase
MGGMRVALVQLAADLNWEANLAAVSRLAANVQAELIVLPEAVMHDFGPVDTPLGPAAQPLDGPFVAALGELARQWGATVVAGMFERSDDPDRPYNTLVAVGPDGGVLASYRKAHLYDSFGYRESDRLRAGEPVAVAVDVAGFRLGLQTCYDLRFPEHSRTLVDAGANVLLVPAAWVRGPLKEDQWLTLLRARAVENTSYVAAAAQCGSQYCGRSVLVDPMGVPVAALGEAEGVAVGEVSADRLAAVRSRNPSLQHRRWGVSAIPADR